MRYPSSVSFVTYCFFAAVSIAATGASPQKISELIMQLASPNASPGKVDEVADEYPPGFDRAAQERVFKAWRQLYDLGITAFPYLIKSIGDKRIVSQWTKDPRT